MKQVLLKHKTDKQHDYYLLEPKIISRKSANELVEKLVDDKEYKIINENGIHASDIGYWILKKNSINGKFVELIHFEDNKDFEVKKTKHNST